MIHSEKKPFGTIFIGRRGTMRGDTIKRDAVPVKKSRKLLFQIGILLVPLLFLMLMLVSQTMYRSTVDGFLQGQDNLMEDRLNLLFEYGLSSFDETEAWLYDYWESHPDVFDSPLTAEEEEALFDYYAKTDAENIWDPEFVRNMPEELQHYSAKEKMHNLQNLLFLDGEEHDYAKDQQNLYDLFIMDVNEPYEGFLIASYSKQNNALTPGETLEYSLSAHPALRSLLSKPSDRIEYETSHNFPTPGSYYIAFRPILYNGEVRAVAGLVYNLEGLRKSMSRILRSSFLVGIGGLVISILLLLFLLYRKAILPVKKIQESIQTYIQTGDSAAVSDGLSSVRSRNEIGILSEDLSTMVRAIDHYTEENVRMAEEREKVETELALAARIQNAMLPKDPPEHALFSLSAFMTPAKEVGGDFYDYYYLDEDHLVLTIADVSGKGIPAALFMMMCKNMIKNYAKEGLPPSEILDRTNRSILENSQTTMFLTVWIGIYEISSGHITAANAGHEYPMLRSSDGSFTLFKDRHSIVAGGLENAVFREYGFDLEPGGTLFLYTDGAAEASNSKDEFFGTERMLAALNREPDSPPEQLIRNMRSAIDQFVGDMPQFDDLTMLAIRRTPPV